MNIQSGPTETDTSAFSDTGQDSAAPSVEKHRLRLIILTALMESAAFFAAFLVAALVYPFQLSDPPLEAALRHSLLLWPPFILVALLTKTYKFRVIVTTTRSMSQLLFALVVASALIFFVTFYAKSTAELSRVIFTSALVMFFFAAVAIRFVLTRILYQTVGSRIENVLIVRAGGPPVNVPGSFSISAADQGLVPNLDDPHSLDRAGRVFRNMDRVIISCEHDDRPAWAPLLRATGVEGEFVSSSLREMGAYALRVTPDSSTIVVSKRPLSVSQRLQKRTLDLIVSACALILLAPLFAVVAALIVLEDGGGVFFKQQRVGHGNRFFDIYKFRSMKVARQDKNASQLTQRDDDRVTRIGDFIRKTSIDELPQLINVLKGEMSLVGPRPHALGALAGEQLYWRIDERYWYRHALKPGLTGLAQVRGFRGTTETESDLADRLHSDLEYLSDWSLLKDAKIIIRTFGVLIHNKAF